MLGFHHPYCCRIYKSTFYCYNFHMFRLFGFGKEEVDVYRFMINMICSFVTITSIYVFVVVDFLQTIIWKGILWKSLFAAVGAR